MNRPKEPSSRRWREVNVINRQEEPDCDEPCCILNCHSPASIRNFQSLRGNWPLKSGIERKKICIYHYNCDLKQYPRKRKRKAVEEKTKWKEQDDFVAKDDPRDQDYIDVNQGFESTRKRRKRRKIDTKSLFRDDLCSIRGCNEIASIRNYSSLRGKWTVKREMRRRKKNKICNRHYQMDLKNNPRKKILPPQKPNHSKGWRKEDPDCKLHLLYITALLMMDF